MKEVEENSHFQEYELNIKLSQFPEVFRLPNGDYISAGLVTRCNSYAGPKHPLEKENQKDQSMSKLTQE
ncbi:unnamed protein product [Rhizopus stolonifer]